MNHRHLLIFAIRVGLIGTISTLGRELPLSSVGHPDCKGIAWNELTEKCKIKILEQGSVSDTTKDNASLFFSALRGSSYTQPHKEKTGSHPSLDIATNQGTPVYSIHDGEVVKAGYQPGYGNSITIQHVLEDDTIFSNYSHLDRIDVTPGQRVESGDKIGEVGRSGFTMGSFGYHLDFQITTADSPAHPYGFHDCEGTSYVSAVNLGACKEKLEAYTIDPLEFFKQYSSIDLHPIIAYDAQRRIDGLSGEDNNGVFTPPKRQRAITTPENTDNTEEDTSRTQPATPTGPNVIHLIEEIDELTNNEEFIVSADRRFRIRRILSDFNKTLTKGEFTNIKVFVEDLLGNPHSGQLPETIRIHTTSSGISVLPGSIRTIRQGEKNVFLRLKERGVFELTFRYGDQNLGSITLHVE